MMKSVILYLLMLMIPPRTSVSVKVQKPISKFYSSLSRDGIKGNVAMTEISFYTIDTLKKMSIQDSCCITRSIFDRKGNSIKMGRYNTRGVYQGGTETKYHSNGLIKQIRFLNKDNRETAREEYFIDGMGKYTGGDAYDEGKLLRKFKINGQNKYGQWTSFNWYSLDGSVYREEEYIYDENRKIGEVWKEYKDDPKGMVVQDMMYKYNIRGELILQQGIHSFLGPVNETSNRIFEYDKYGNWIQYIILNSTGKPVRLVKRSLAYR